MRTAHWTTRDGRRILLVRMEDDHLVSALRMGLRAEQRRQTDAALEALGHAMQGDSGCEYLGEVGYEDAMRRACSLRHLKSALARNARYAPLLKEADRRGLSLLRRKPARGH